MSFTFSMFVDRGSPMTFFRQPFLLLFIGFLLAVQLDAKPLNSSSSSTVGGGVKRKLEYRINNGFRLHPGELPSVVLLTGNKLRCTGTLITPRKVLTAGHCVCGGATEEAFANVTNAMERFASSVQMRNVLYVTYPYEYDRACEQLGEIARGEDRLNDENRDQGPLGGSMDIAIVTLEDPFDLVPGYVELGEMVNPYKWDDPDDPPRRGWWKPPKHRKRHRPEDITRGLVAGFGRDDASNVTGELKFGFPVLDQCPEFDKIDATGGYCAKKSDNFQLPDIGDSGGPLFDEHGRIVGVTSISGHGWIIFASVHENAEFLREQMLDF